MIQWTGEAEPGRPFWWEGMEWPELEGRPPEAVDILVVGAGYTGLSAARVAHDAGAKVAVIDAGQPGKGASTRNGGMLGAHSKNSWEQLNSKYGSEVADALFTEAGPALQWVKDMIREEEIECHLQETGRMQLAWTRADFENQKKTAVTVEKHGVACEVLDRVRIEDEILTPCYHGGILFPEHGAVHPAMYFQGMLNAVLRREIPVVSHCPALSFEKQGAKYRIETQRGTIHADKIILATNGYTSSPFGWFARRVFPLPSFLITTEVLSANLISELAPGRRMMVETRAQSSYFRISPDGSRLIFGGRAAMVDIDPLKAAKRLHRTMCQVWPALHDVKLSHVWTGNTGYSFAHIPHVGERDGIHFAMGYSGRGTVMAPFLGAKAGWQAVGDERGNTPYSKTKFAPRWFHPGGQPLFLQASNVWYREWVDRADNRAARR